MFLVDLLIYNKYNYICYKIRKKMLLVDFLVYYEHIISFALKSVGKCWSF